MSHLVNFIPGNFNIQDINATYINQMCFLCQIPVLLAWLDEWLCVTGRRKEGGVFYDVEDRRHKYYLCLIKTQLQNQLNWFVFWCAYTSIWKTQQPGRAYTEGKMQSMQYWFWWLEPHYWVCVRVCVCLERKGREKERLFHIELHFVLWKLLLREFTIMCESKAEKRGVVFGGSKDQRDK